MHIYVLLEARNPPLGLLLEVRDPLNVNFRRDVSSLQRHVVKNLCVCTCFWTSPCRHLCVKCGGFIAAEKDSCVFTCFSTPGGLLWEAKKVKKEQFSMRNYVLFEKCVSFSMRMYVCLEIGWF